MKECGERCPNYNKCCANALVEKLVIALSWLICIKISVTKSRANDCIKILNTIICYKKFVSKLCHGLTVATRH